MELFKKAIKTCGFLGFLKCDFQNFEYFVRRVQKMLRHTELVIQKAYKNEWFFDTFEIMKSKNIEKHKARATAHRRRLRPGMKFQLTCTLF